CALLPARQLGWARHGRNIAITLTAPAQAPLRLLVNSGRSHKRLDAGVTVEDLAAQLDAAQLQIARLASDNEALRQMIAELQSGQTLGIDSSVRQLAADVIGGGDAVNGS